MNRTLIEMRGRCPNVLRAEEEPTRGSVNVDEVCFRTDEAWTGYMLTAQFFSPFSGQSVAVLPDARGVCVIPPGITCGESGAVEVTLVGTKGDRRLVSEPAILTVRATAYTDETEENSGLDLTLAQQLNARVKDAEQTVAEVRRAYEAGELKGEPGSDASVTAQSITEALGFCPIGQSALRSFTDGLEHVLTYTFDGQAANCFLTTDAEGRAFDFDAVLIVGMSAGAEDGIANAGVIQVNGDRLFGGAERTRLVYTPTGVVAKMFAAYHDTRVPLTLCVARTARDAGYQAAQCTFEAVRVDAIRAIEFQSNGVTPGAGATLSIWARRRGQG